MTAPGETSAPDLEPAPVAPDATSGWHRLDPRMIIVKPLHEGVRIVPFLILLVVAGRGDPQRLWWSLGAIGLLLVTGFVHWWRTRYRITGEQVELHTGLIARQRLAVARDRIRTVETTARFGHRMFGLAEVRIGTGQHDQKRKGPLSLDAITATEAERLRRELLRRVRAARPDAGTGGRAAGAGIAAGGATAGAATELARLDRRWIRYAPLTLSGLTFIGVLIGLFFRALNELELDPVASIRSLLGWVNGSAVAVTVVLAVVTVVILATIAALVGYVVQFAHYRLTREADGSLHVRRGLLTSRTVTIEQARLRGVALHRPLLLRAGGGARLTALTTGLARASGGGLLLPPAPRAEADRVAALALLADRSPVAAPLARHPRPALSRRLVRALAGVLLLAGALAAAGAAGWPDWPWIAALCLLVPAVPLALDRYRALGHGLAGPYLVCRSGSLRRRTVAMQRTGIIGWKLHQSVFQRRVGLATLTATTAAGQGAYEVVDLDAGDAVALADAALPGLLTPFLTGPAATGRDDLSSRG